MTTESTKLHVSDTTATTAGDVAQWLYHLVHESTGTFTIALAGGSTPKLLYRLVASDYIEKLQWERIHWYFGDERFVPLDHPDSNYRMVCEQLFDAAPVPPDNVHPFNTSLPDEDRAACDYHALLEKHRDVARPLFDVVLLGIGDDGHTASLFPGTPALDEKNAWAVSTPVGARPEPRVSLTFNAIASSRHVAFLVCGAGKRVIVADIFAGADYPATRVKSDGTMRWFLDKDAAFLLTQGGLLPRGHTS